MKPICPVSDTRVRWLAHQKCPFISTVSEAPGGTSDETHRCTHIHPWSIALSQLVHPLDARWCCWVLMHKTTERACLNGGLEGFLGPFPSTVADTLRALWETVILSLCFILPNINRHFQPLVCKLLYECKTCYYGTKSVHGSPCSLGTAALLKAITAPWPS